MFKKYYTVNVVDSKGSLCGSLYASAYFWRTPKDHYLELKSEAKKSDPNLFIVDFRRVR